MFKLGEYEEDDAKEIISYLKDAGMKVELKTYLEGKTEEMNYLEGKLSELRGEIKDFEKYERYLEAAKVVAAKSTSQEDFRDRFLSEIDPDWKDKRSQMIEILEDSSDLVSGLAYASEDADARKERQKKLITLIGYIAESSMAFEFVDFALSRNSIKIGEEIGDRLNDPVLRIKVDSEDYDPEHKLAKRTLFIYLDKQYEVYIDAFSTTLADEFDEEFMECYPDEHLQIMALGLLMEDLTTNSAVGKIDMEEFAERCDLVLEKEGNILEIDGSDVTEEIARALEKNGVIKVKGDTIKWKV